MTTLTIHQLADLLSKACTRETSADPAGWTPENPLWGHCAVVALVVQDHFGGTIQRVSLEGTPFEAMRSHYLNHVTPHDVADLTWDQFEDKLTRYGVPEERSRAYLLSNEGTKRRYHQLQWQVAKALHEGAPIFEDHLYRQAFFAALDSPCMKMRFGCVMTRHGDIVAVTNNATIGPLKALCEQTCIRSTIASRTESMIGACGHAEEHALWNVVHRGIPPSECELYVAGVHMNGLPWMKPRSEHTCLRCSTQMHYAQIKTVHSPVIDRWEGITAERAVETAKAYALGQMTIQKT